MNDDELHQVEPSDAASDLRERVAEYLQLGGLFNPELMGHEKVRDLIVDLRNALPEDGPSVKDLLAVAPTPALPVSRVGEEMVDLAVRGYRKALRSIGDAPANEQCTVAMRAALESALNGAALPGGEAGVYVVDASKMTDEEAKALRPGATFTPVPLRRVTDFRILPEAIERMAAAAWDLHANRKWSEIPEEWKPFYRDNMRAALKAMAP